MHKPSYNNPRRVKTSQGEKGRGDRKRREERGESRTTCRHLSSIDLDPASRLLRRSTQRCGSRGPGMTLSRSATLPTSCPRSGPRSMPCKVRPRSLAVPTTLLRLCCRPRSLRLAASRSPTRMRSPRPLVGSPPSRPQSRPPRFALKNQLGFWVSGTLGWDRSPTVLASDRGFPA